MDLKTGYRSTEVGLLPSDWELVRFADILEFRNGVNADKTAYGTGTPFVNVFEIINNSHLQIADIPGRIRLPAQMVESFGVRRGDALFNRSSETQEEVGLAATYLGSEAAVFGGFVIRARPKNAAALDPKYSGYSLRSKLVRRQIVARGQGAIRANIGQHDLRSVLFPCPPVVEQQAIAMALSDVDALLGALDRFIVKKRDLKRAVMQRLLTGQARLSGFTGKWETKQFGDLFTFLKTANNSRADLSPQGDVGYIHYGDIHTGSSAFLDCRGAEMPRIHAERVHAATLLEDGDLVMADASEDYAGVGKSVEVLGVAGQRVVAGLHTFLLRGNTGLVANGFKGYLQFVPQVRESIVRLATGLSVYGLSKGNVKQVAVAVPPVDEQTAIAAVLFDMDAELSALKRRRDKTRLLKQGMMQELLTGKTRLV